MKTQPIINLSSPTIRWAQQRADESGNSFYLIHNETNGMDIVPVDHARLDINGNIRQPFAIVHPHRSHRDDVLEKAQ